MKKAIKCHFSLGKIEFVQKKVSKYLLASLLILPLYCLLLKSCCWAQLAAHLTADPGVQAPVQPQYFCGDLIMK